MMHEPWLKFYDKDVPPKIETPNSTIYEQFVASCLKHKELVALEFLGKKIKYGELLNLVNKFASALKSLGLKRGDRLAIFLPNCPQFVISWLAPLKLGAIAVPLNPLNTERELLELLKDNGAKIIVVLAKKEFASKIYNIKEKTNIKTIITTSIREFLPSYKKPIFSCLKVVDEVHDKIYKLLLSNENFSGLISKQKEAQNTGVNIFIDNSSPTDVAALQYTFGTTGTPKAVMLSHINLISNYLQVYSWMTEYEMGKEVLLGVLPFFHVYGLTTVMTTGLFTGSKIILLPIFDVKKVLAAIHKQKVTIFHGVPAMYAKINETNGLEKINFSSLKFCISGAARLEKEIKDKFEKLTGAILVEGYGMSEASPVTHINPLLGKQRVGSVGLPIPSTEAKILDINNPDIELPVGERGQIAIRGPQVMQGYWNNKEETKKVFHNGWFLTGDIAVMDKEGYFFIIDRLKEMLIVGGENIYPSEIEKVLLSHPSIIDAMVIGMSHKILGHVPKAFVVKKDNISAEELVEFCKKNLTKFKVPRTIEFRREKLPRSLVGKALKKDL